MLSPQYKQNTSMPKIIAKKDLKYVSGSIPKIAALIKMNPETIRRWKRDDKKVVYKNGWEVGLDYQELK